MSCIVFLKCFHLKWVTISRAARGTAMYQAHQVYFNMKFSQCFVEAMFNGGDSWYGWLRLDDAIHKHMMVPMITKVQRRIVELWHRRCKSMPNIRMASNSGLKLQSKWGPSLILTTRNRGMISMLLRRLLAIKWPVYFRRSVVYFPTMFITLSAALSMHERHLWNIESTLNAWKGEISLKIISNWHVYWLKKFHIA